MTAATPSTPDTNLQTLALFISNSVCRAIQAQHVMRAAELYFHAQSDPTNSFRTHPTNTLAYQAVAALEARCVVHISETLKDEHHLLPTSAPIRRKADLVLHRHGLSHPAAVHWNTAKMQKFFDEGRLWTDLRPALIWDLQKSINDELRARGLPTYNDDIPVTPEMAAMLHLILSSSVNDGYEAPPPDQLFRWLEEAQTKFIAKLEAHPDGRT